MGKTTNVARRRAEASTRERAAAARAAATRRGRRHRLFVVGGSAIGVLVLIGVFVAIGATSHPRGDTSRPDAPVAVVDAVRDVPAATMTAVGAGTSAGKPKAAGGPALTIGGHPEVLFIGAEFCPYCAAERWPLVQALSRFGTFSGLKTVHSASNDVYPNTATFSFYGATYRSDVVSFTGREVQTVDGKSLEQPTAAETTLWKKFTGQGSYPFLDIAGRYVFTTPSYDPGVLGGLTATEIASQLADPTSKVAKAVDGAANVLTAAICQATNNAPASVCTAPGVIAAAKTLNG